jgi:branched-chain amino acid transport system substrate-binding protein
MRWRALSVLALVIALGAVACGTGKTSGGGGGGGGGTLRIGAALSLTGSLAREGLLTKQGYEVCKKVINDKGGVKVGGSSLNLDIAYQDDKSEPDVAAQLVDRFNDDGVKLILGPYGSASTEAASAVVERNGQVMADSAGADDKIFDKGYKRTFAVLSPATKYAASIVQAVAELARPKPKTVAILTADDGFSKTAAKQSRELGVAPSGGFGETVAPPTPTFRQTLGKSAEGVLGSSQWVPQVTGQDKWFGTAKDYVATYKQQYGQEPEYHNAEATAACLALALAVEKAGSTQPDKVRDAMASLDVPSFFGPIKFDSTGKNVTKPMAVIQIQNGKVVTVWPKDAQEAPLRWPTAA